MALRQQAPVGPPPIRLRAVTAVGRDQLAQLRLPAQPPPAFATKGGNRKGDVPATVPGYQLARKDLRYRVNR